MGYLGYDRARLGALRRRLGDLSDEAAGLTFSDQLAAEAANLYRRAAGLMTGWRTDLAAIDSCSFGSPYQPVALDPADPAFIDLLRPTDAAWATVSDPRSGLFVGVEEHARHLAEYLAAVNVSDVLGDQRRADEVTRLLANVMADSQARQALLASLGPGGFGGVAEDLARRVAPHGASAEATRQADEASRLLGALATGFGEAYRAGSIDRPSWDALLADRIDPYATALVLRSAGLAGEDLVRLAGAAWHRWSQTWNDGIDELAVATEQTPSILLDVLAADPVAARRIIETFTEDDFALLFGPTIPRGAALPFLLASADPRSGPPDDMERSMAAVLDFLSHHKDLADWSFASDALGAYVGPYLEQLVGPCGATDYPVRPWMLPGVQPAELLGWIAQNEAAAASLLTWAEAIVATRITRFAAADTFQGPLVNHVATIAGLVDRAVADAHVLSAEQQNEAWQAAWSILGGTTSGLVKSAAPTLSGPVTSILVSKSVGLGVNWMRDQLQANGWVGAPTTVGSVVAAEGVAIDEREGRREAAYLAARFAAGQAAGTMPATSAPPPFTPGASYFPDALNAWRREATDPQDRTARDALWQAASEFDGGALRPVNKFRVPGDACPAPAASSSP